MPRCTMITHERVQRAFVRAIGDNTLFIRPRTLLRKVAYDLRMTPGEIKACYSLAFFISNMDELGWEYNTVKNRFEPKRERC